MPRSPRRNPLDPEAWKWDPAPTALKGPGGSFRKDDRRGVHCTPNFGLALWYATAKISANSDGNIPVIFELNTEGLQAFPDYDAVVEREHTDLKETAYFALEEMEPRHVVNYLRRNGEEESEMCNEDVQDIAGALKAGSKTSVYSVIADAAEVDVDGVLDILRSVRDGSGEAPLEWFAEAIQQWRYFDVIGLDRLVSVILVKPFSDELLEDWDAVEEKVKELNAAGVKDDEMLTYFAEDVLGDFLCTGAELRDFVTKRIDVSKPTTTKKYSGPRIEYHGTDLFRAQIIFPELKLVSPWNIKE